MGWETMIGLQCEWFSVRRCGHPLCPWQKNKQEKNDRIFILYICTRGYGNNLEEQGQQRKMKLRPRPQKLWVQSCVGDNCVILRTYYQSLVLLYDTVFEYLHMYFFLNNLFQYVQNNLLSLFLHWSVKICLQLKWLLGTNMVSLGTAVLC